MLVVVLDHTLQLLVTSCLDKNIRLFSSCIGTVRQLIKSWGSVRVNVLSGNTDHCRLLSMAIAVFSRPLWATSIICFKDFAAFWISANIFIACAHFVVHWLMPSVLWHCWLGIRKSIQSVKIECWGVGVVICLERGADCLHMLQLMPLHPITASSLASFKSRLVLPFWYWLTQVVQEKRPLNGCSSVL